MTACMLKPIIASNENSFVSDNPSQMKSTRWALSALSLSLLLSALGTSSANVALPTLAAAFHASFQEVQWIVLAYLLAITTVIVTAGRLGDLIGRRRLLLIGLLLFTVASVLCGTAHALWQIIAARAVQGLGAAIMMALSVALVGETVPKENTGRAMGILGTMSAIGTALGPSLGGVLIAGFGWHAIFFINVPLGLVTFLLALRHLPMDRHKPTPNRSDLDIMGTLLLALTLGAYALAMTIGRGKFGLINVTLLAAAAGGLALFVRTELRAAAPLIPVAIFRVPALASSLGLSTIVATVIMATLVVGPFYLVDALGLSPGMMGLVMTTGPLSAALAGMPSGRMVDRHGPHRMTLVGLIAIALGCFSLSTFPPAFGIVGYVGPLTVITAGYALFQTANNTAVMRDVRQEQRGIVSGMLQLSRNLGLVTGSSVMAALFAGASALSASTAGNATAVASGMRATFAFGGILVVMPLVISITMINEKCALARKERPRRADSVRE